MPFLEYEKRRVLVCGLNGAVDPHILPLLEWRDSTQTSSIRVKPKLPPVRLKMEIKRLLEGS